MAEIRARLAEAVIEGPGGSSRPPGSTPRSRPSGPGAPPRDPVRPPEGRRGPARPAPGRRPAAAGGGGRDAGAASPEALLAGAAGLDLAAVAASGEGLLDATDDVAGRALAGAAAAALGDAAPAEAADLPRIVRAPQLEDEVSSSGARDVAARTLELLELELPGGGRPRRGREGLALWLETLGALGAALAASGASPRLPGTTPPGRPEPRKGVGAAARGLAADPAWLARAAGVRDAGAVARAAGAARLLAARAAAARAVALARGGEAPMSRALGLEWPAALTLADGLAGLGPADELRAQALSAALRAHLREAHGARWFADPRAGRLLRELWLEGGALEPEALASELGRRGWTPARSPPSSPAPWAEWCPVVPAQAQRRARRPRPGAGRSRSRPPRTRRS